MTGGGTFADLSNWYYGPRNEFLVTVLHGLVAQPFQAVHD
jgi:hypothetical protein